METKNMSGVLSLLTIIIMLAVMLSGCIEGLDKPYNRVTDLTAATGSGTWTPASKRNIVLKWTVPADDEQAGAPEGYRVSYSKTGEITQVLIYNVKNFPQTWTPGPAGSQETHIVDGLENNTKYWFVIRIVYADNKISGVSNSPHATTQPA